MKKLIICRHGEIDQTRRLSLAGEEQIRALAELLRPHVQSESNSDVRLLTSTAPRAIGSSRILLHALGIKDVRRCADLWSGDAPVPHDAQLALKLVRDNESSDVVIVMTHLELCEELPPLFGRDVLGTAIAAVRLERGQARLIDCIEKTDAVVG